MTMMMMVKKNDGRCSVASIRLISSDLQNILGTKPLRWAEAEEKEDGGSSMKESLTRPSSSSYLL